MKKVLAITLALFLVAGVAFAGVSFTGGVTAGYAIGAGPDADGNWGYAGGAYGIYGVGDGNLNFNVTGRDDNGVWSFTTAGYVRSSDDYDGISNHAGADISVNLSKALGFDGPAINVGGYFNDQNPSLRSVNTRGIINHFDRIRTASAAYGFYVEVAGDIFDVKLAGNPATTVFAEGKRAQYEKEQNGTVALYDFKEEWSFVLSTLFTPVSGIGVNAAVGYNTGYAYTGILTGSVRGQGDIAFNLGANVNIGDLLDFDFDLGLSVAFTGTIDTEYGYDQTIVFGEVYGGFKGFRLSVQAAYLGAATGATAAGEVVNQFFAGATSDIQFTDAWGLGLYLAFVVDLNNSDSLDFLAGGKVSYATESGVSLNLGLEYSYAGQSYNNYGAGIAGFYVIPSISWSF